MLRIRSILSQLGVLPLEGSERSSDQPGVTGDEGRVEEEAGQVRQEGGPVVTVVSSSGSALLDSVQQKVEYPPGSPEPAGLHFLNGLHHPSREVSPQTDTFDAGDDLQYTGHLPISRFLESTQPTYSNRDVPMYPPILLSPASNIQRLEHLTSLGQSQRIRFAYSNELADLDGGIHFLEEALCLVIQLADDDTSAVADVMEALSKLHSLRYQRVGDQGPDLNLSIVQNQSSVMLTPPGNPNRLSRLTRVGTLFLARFTQMSHIDDFDAALDGLQDACDSAPHGSVSDQWTFNSAIQFCGEIVKQMVGHAIGAPDGDSIVDVMKGLITRLERAELLGRNSSSEDLAHHAHSGLVACFGRLIHSLRTSIDNTPSDSTFYADLAEELGFALVRRFGHTAQLDDIEEAPDYYRLALTNSPAENADYLRRLLGLVECLRQRYICFTRLADLEECITRGWEAVGSTVSISEAYPKSLLRLVEVLGRRYQISHIKDDFNDAQNLAHTALDFTRSQDGGRDRAMAFRQLATLYEYRFDHSANEADIEESVRLFHEGLRIIPKADPAYLPFLSDIADAFTKRFAIGGSVHDIDTAVDYQQAVITAAPPNDDINRAAFLTNVARSLFTRYMHFRQPQDIRAAIEHQRQALGLTDARHAQYCQYVNHVGSLCLAIDDTDGAVYYGRMAKSSAHPGDPTSANIFLGLGNALSKRFANTGDVADIEEAIDCFTAASNLPSLLPIDKFFSLLALGQARLTRFLRLKDEQDLNRAVDQTREAVDALRNLNSSHSLLASAALGRTLRLRFAQTGNPVDREESIRVFRDCGDLPLVNPEDRLVAASGLTELIWHSAAPDVEQFKSALRTCVRAVPLLHEVAWIGFDAERRLETLHELASETKSLPSDAAACACRIHELDPQNSDEYLVQAVELLDHGRSIIWSQGTQFRRENRELEIADAGLAEEMKRLRKALDQHGFGQQSEAVENAHRRHAVEWQRLLTKIRRLPGFETFLLPLTFSQLREASSDANTVIINVSSHRCDAIIVPPHGSLHLVPLDQLSLDDVGRLAGSLLNDLLPSAGRPWAYAERPRKNFHDSHFLECLYELWERIAEPVLWRLDHINGGQDLHRVRWCLTGSLCFLPIHAARPRPEPFTQQRDMLDRVVSSYIPTLSAIIDSRRSQTKTAPLRMLAVGMPGDGLPCAGDEMNIVASQSAFEDATLLIDDGATVSNVSKELRACSWVHFACHAQQNVVEPMKSGFRLKDGVLSVLQLSQKPLSNADFAMLLACETGKGTAQYSDEVIHLAAALQFAGFRSIISTMWSISDHDGPVVAKEVYHHLILRTSSDGLPDSSKAAYALRAAVLHLRDDLGRSPLGWAPFMHVGL